MNVILSFFTNILAKLAAFCAVYFAGKREAEHEATEETKAALEVVVAVDSRVDSMPDTDELCDALNRRK